MPAPVEVAEAARTAAIARILLAKTATALVRAIVRVIVATDTKRVFDVAFLKG
jgi:hypothetical protein